MTKNLLVMRLSKYANRVGSALDVLINRFKDTRSFYFTLCWCGLWRNWESHYGMTFNESLPNDTLVLEFISLGIIIKRVLILQNRLRKSKEKLAILQKLRNF